MKRSFFYGIALTLGLLVVAPAPAAPPGQARGQKQKRGNKQKRGAVRPAAFNGARLVSPGTLARLQDGPYPLRLAGAGGIKLVAQVQGRKVANVVATDPRGQRLAVRKFGRGGRVYFSFRDPRRGPTSLYFPASMVVDGPPASPDAPATPPDGPGAKPPASATPPAEGGEEEPSPPPPDGGAQG
jgi:hypothetical protein